MAIVSALEYNTFFRGLKVSHSRLSHETLERILHVLRRSMWLEELHLEALGLRWVLPSSKEMLSETISQFDLHDITERTFFIN